MDRVSIVFGLATGLLMAGVLLPSALLILAGIAFLIAGILAD